MSALEEFQNSNAWDARFQLPTVPQHNNPHLYLAFAEKILGNDLQGRAIFAYKCLQHSNLYNRWPDGGGGNISYDELIGLSSQLLVPPCMVWWMLKRNFGRYNNINPSDKSFNHWMYRFPWAMAFIRARATGSPGVWRIAYALTLLFDAVTYRVGDEEGRLRIWLTLDEMSKYFGCRLAIRAWRNKMHSLGLSPKSCLSISFKDIPVYSVHAPTCF